MRRATADASASYAVEVSRLLWPQQPAGEPRTVRGRRGAEPSARDLLVFPSPDRPRLLVPADVPAALTMLKRLGNDRRRFAGAQRAAVQAAVRSPLFGLTRWPALRISATGTDSIETHLAGCFGREVRVGIVLGPRRVNQKPVLQVFALDGELLGFAKVGHNPLTAALVAREAAALTAIRTAAPRSFAAPRPVHDGEWSGLRVLVMSPLVSDPRVPVPETTRTAAMRELATVTAVPPAPLTDTPLWSRLERALADLASSPEGPALRRSLDALASDHGSDPIALGGWHGDFGVWNMGMGVGPDAGVLQLWDWERYDAAVPLGFDGLHLAAQRVRPNLGDVPTAERELLARAPGIIAELGGDPAQVGPTLRLYLLEMGLRYADALQHGATPALRVRVAWVLDLLARLSQDRVVHVLSEGQQ